MIANSISKTTVACIKWLKYNYVKVVCALLWGSMYYVGLRYYRRPKELDIDCQQHHLAEKRKKNREEKQTTTTTTN